MARIIVIDDEADVRALLRTILESENHEIDEAKNGTLAIEALGKNHYDLIITDVLMPEEDGIAVAKQASELQPNAKILAISGGGEYLDASHLLNVMEMLGVNATLLKPFGRDDLIAVVDDLLGRKLEIGNPVARAGIFYYAR